MTSQAKVRGGATTPDDLRLADAERDLDRDRVAMGQVGWHDPAAKFCHCRVQHLDGRVPAFHAQERPGGSEDDGIRGRVASIADLTLRLVLSPPESGLGPSGCIAQLDFRVNLAVARGDFVVHRIRPSTCLQWRAEPVEPTPTAH